MRLCVLVGLLVAGCSGGAFDVAPQGQTGTDGGAADAPAAKRVMAVEDAAGDELAAHVDAPASTDTWDDAVDDAGETEGGLGSPDVGDAGHGDESSEAAADATADSADAAEAALVDGCVDLGPGNTGENFECPSGTPPSEYTCRNTSAAPGGPYWLCGPKLDEPPPVPAGLEACTLIYPSGCSATVTYAPDGGVAWQGQWQYECDNDAGMPVDGDMCRSTGGVPSLGITYYCCE